jgi:hypothetical protein
MSFDLTLAEAGREVGPLAAEVGRERDTLATEACRERDILATEACRDLTLAEAGREVGPLAAEVGRESDTLATEACRDGPRLSAEDAALMGAASAHMAEPASPERYEIISMEQGVTKRCRLSFLTNSALVIRVPMRGEGGVAGSLPMSKALHIT